MKPLFKSVIFDLDGTLIDTIADIALCMNKALMLHGLPPVDEKAYKTLVGRGMKRLASSVMPPELQRSADAETCAASLADDALRFYKEAPVVHTTPYNGIRELLAELKRRKLRTAVLSNKPDVMAHIVVHALFPQGSFDVIRGEIDGKPSKPAPEPVWDILVEIDSSPRDTVFLGDSEIDMETARASGCHAVGAAWGFRSYETLAKAGAERIIDTPLDFLEILCV
ncbi:MAG: HAD family hydrolase [Treponema sp.]|jgi:phosphoglycolate phosphatase|nr:HAD family hydrolase [Treponema sp.]